MPKSHCLPLVFFVFAMASATVGQEPTRGVDLKLVKYDGLKDAIVKNRGKVVVIDFWGTFCPPCMKGFPHVVEMHKRLHQDGVEVITVSLDDLSDNRDKTSADVLSFLKRQGAECTNLLLDEPFEFVQARLRLDSVPRCYVFSRQGKWTQFDPGPNKEIDYKAMDRLVEELLREE